MTRAIPRLVVLMLLSVPFYAVRPGSASNPGTICVVPAGVSSCNSTMITGVYGRTLQVAVLIQGSDSLNGVDVYLHADTRLLSPRNVSLTGSAIQNPTILAVCIGGILITGLCASTDDGSTIHVALVTRAGTLTSAPFSGLLFTAIYDVVGVTAQTTIGLSGYVSNGSTTFLPENFVSATFSEFSDFTIVLDQTMLSGTVGSTVSTNAGFQTVGDFMGSVSLSSFVNASTTDPTAAASQLNVNQVSLPSSTHPQVSITATSPGTYYVIITAQSGSLKHAILLEATFSSHDFSMSGSPATWEAHEAVWYSILSLSGIRGDSTVTLTNSAGTLNTTTVSVHQDGTSYVRLTLEGNGTYTVTATSNEIVRYLTVELSRDLSVNTARPGLVQSCPSGRIDPVPRYVRIDPGSSSTLTLDGFDQNAEAVFLAPSHGYTAAISSSSLYCQIIVTISASEQAMGGNHTLFISEETLAGVKTSSTIIVDPPPTGDLNGDSAVNSTDVGTVLSAFGSHAGDPRYSSIADFDHDGYIGIVDVSIVYYNYGT